MSDTSMPSSKTWCQAVRSKFNFPKRKNDKIIKNQKKNDLLRSSKCENASNTHLENSEIIKEMQDIADRTNSLYLQMIDRRDIEIWQLNEKYNSHFEQNKTLRKEIEDRKLQLRLANIENQYLQKLVANSALREQKLNERNAIAVREKQELKEATEDLKKEVSEYKDALSEARTNIDTLKKSLENSVLREETSDERNAKTEQENQELKKQNIPLRREIEDMKRKFKLANIDNEYLQKSLEVLEERCKRKISLLSKQDEIFNRFKAINEQEKQELKKVSEDLKKKVSEYKDELSEARTNIDTMKDIVKDQLREIQILRSRWIPVMNAEGFENFPKNVFDQFSKLNMQSENVALLEDEIFNKELVKRMICKICVSDVERLRCSTCLKGICRGCHTKVAACPHCRDEKKDFQPIIMTRL